MQKKYFVIVCLILFSVLNIKAIIFKPIEITYNPVVGNVLCINNSSFSFELNNDFSLFNGKNISDIFLKNNESQKLLKLKAYNDSSPDLADETIIYFDVNATVDYDATLDELKQFSKDELKPDIYTMSKTDRFSINTVPDKKEMTLPLGFAVKVDGTYWIDATDTSNFKSGMDIYLIDMLLDKTQDIIKQPLYKFTFNRTDFENRFFIKFVNKALHLAVDKISDNTSLLISSQNRYVKVVYNSSQQKQGQLEVMNLLGQNIIKETKIVNGEYKYMLEKGFYIVKLVSDSKVYVRKIYVE